MNSLTKFDVIIISMELWTIIYIKDCTFLSHLQSKLCKGIA